MNQFELGTANTIISLLLIASLVAIAVRYIRVPYTVALVLVGLAVGVLPVLPSPVELPESINLLVFLPALLFEASLRLDFQHLRHDIRTILTLAVPGVLLSSFLIGAILYLGAWVLGYELSPGPAILFGVLISATDPVAVIALFRPLGVPRRLAYIVEGESLFNDAVAVVIFGIVLEVVLSASGDLAQEISLRQELIKGVIQFLRVSAGGVALGALVGYLVAQAMQRLDDYLIEVTLTTILAYGTFLVAEQLDVSGVIAVVIAGLLMGNYGISMSMSPTTRIVLMQIWEYIGFLANSLIFLLIGLGVKVANMVQNLALIAVAIVAVLVARAIVIYAFGVFINRYLNPLPMRWRHVLFWGGLRGAIALALALSLSSNVPQHDNLQAITFGVVLFTLVIQGLSMAPLLRWLRLGELREEELEYERKWGQLYALEAAWRRLEQLHRDSVISDPVWNELNHAYTTTGQRLNQEIRELVEQHQEVQRRELEQAQREALRAERSALNELVRRGQISEEVYRQLVSDVDRRMASLEEKT